MRHHEISTTKRHNDHDTTSHARAPSGKVRKKCEAVSTVISNGRLKQFEQDAHTDNSDCIRGSTPVNTQRRCDSMVLCGNVLVCGQF